MKSTILFITLLSFLALNSCAKIYYSEDSYELAETHEKIAIIPPVVSIAASRKVAAEAIIEQQKTESLNFQKEIYGWLLKRKTKNQFDPEMLDVMTTNAKLQKAGYPETPMSPEELCEILEVDGLLISSFGLSKPMSQGAAIAVALLGGAGSTNEVKVSLTIQDCSKNKMIWNYDHKYSGGLGSSPSRLVDDMMRQASKKMPYFER